VKRVLVVKAFLLILFFSYTSFAQECPAPYEVCLTEEEAGVIGEMIDHHQCMLDAALNEDIIVEFDPYSVVITKEGQVMDQATMTLTLFWCSFVLFVEAKPNLSIHVQEPRKEGYGFRLRVRIGALIVFDDFSENTLRPALLLEPVYYKSLHLSIFASPQGFGPALGIDLVKNVDAFMGVSSSWGLKSFHPVLGVSFSFN
jgi:hypothetical protein